MFLNFYIFTMSKKFISIHAWWHTTLFLMDKQSHYFFWPCRAMQELGYEVEILVLNSNVKVEDDPNYDKSMKVIYFSNPFKLFSYLRKNKDALVYSQTFTIPTLLAWMFSKHAIFFSHDPVLPWKYSKFYRLKKAWVKFCYKFYKKIRVINDYELQRLEDEWIHGKWIKIPLVISFDNYKKSICDQPNILMLWLIWNKKNPHTLLHAMSLVIKKYPKIKIYQVWKDCWTNWKKIEDLVDMYWLNDNIYILWRRPERLKELDLPTSIYINSSLMEWQCIAVYDASLLGNALCLPKMSSFLWILDSEVKYHDQFDYIQLAENIIWYIEHPEEKEKMIKNNQKWIMDHHNYNNIKNDIQKEFSSVME